MHNLCVCVFQAGGGESYGSNHCPFGKQRSLNALSKFALFPAQTWVDGRAGSSSLR